MRPRVLTPTGIARLLTRGIEDTYTPEYQQAEIGRLVEYLQELAVSRARRAELANDPRSEGDADFLDAIACELEATVAQPR
jgi:hypothetical protein